MPRLFLNKTHPTPSSLLLERSKGAKNIIEGNKQRKIQGGCSFCVSFQRKCNWMFMQKITISWQGFFGASCLPILRKVQAPPEHQIELFFFFFEEGRESEMDLAQKNTKKG